MIGLINVLLHATPEEELRERWHEDMVWWDPAGIGATCTSARSAP